MPTGVPTKQKRCSICGDLFLPEKPSSKICSKQHYSKCPICGKQVIWNSTTDVKPCSKECRRENTKRKNLEKYGVEHPMQNEHVKNNFKKSMKEKYGVEHALQNSDINRKWVNTNIERFGTKYALSNKQIYEKRGNTMKERYGVEYTLQSESLKNKVFDTNINKYGFIYPMQNEDVYENFKNTMVEKYGVENPMQVESIKNRMVETRMKKMDDIIEQIRKTLYKNHGIYNPMEKREFVDKIASTMIERYGVKSAMMVPEFRQKMIETTMEHYDAPYYILSDDYKSTHLQSMISSVNKKFGKFLSDNGIDFTYEYRIENKSYDFKIENTNILIEINPSYTHNTIGNHWSDKGKDKNYHLEKTMLAKEHGFRCINVWDWDDWAKILELIKPKEKIYARNCEIYMLNKDVGDSFVNENHIQGTCRGQLIYFGLVHKDELYQVMTFGESRYDKKYKVELIRMCNKNGFIVVGGSSRLFKFATENYGLYDVISYCDKSKFSGDVYYKMGMKLKRETSPVEIWSKGNKKITSNLLRQRGFDQLFNTDYGKGTSNEQLMLENGWLPVYDCGQYVFEYK